MSFRFFYFLKEAAISFRRNWVMSFASVSAVSVSLILLGFFVLLSITLKGLIQDVEKDFGLIEVFLVDTAPQAKVIDLQKRLQKDPDVRSVTFISKDEALERLKKDFKEDPSFLEEIEVNPLPASLEIRLRDPQNWAAVVKRVGQDKKVIDEVKYAEQTAQRLFAVTKVVRWLGVIFISLLTFAALVLISNTIRLAIFSRRKEIQIMKLVGASNWFIRWPFILEGVMQGTLGALLAAGVLYYAKTFFFLKAQELIPFLAVDLNAGMFGGILLYMVLGGVLIGAIGSTVALRRFLQI